MISWNARFGIVCLLLLATGVYLRCTTRSEALPQGRSLSSLRLQVDAWRGRNAPITSNTLTRLGPGEFLQRRYQNMELGVPFVDLYLAHFPNWLHRHLPTDCLVGSGWSLTEPGTITLSGAGNSSFAVNRFLITRGSDRQVVIYWFWVHGRNAATEHWAGYYVALDHLRSRRDDYMLIRMNTPVAAGENPIDAQRRLLSFADVILPYLNNYQSR